MCVCCRFGFGRAFALLCYLYVPGWGKDQGESAPGFKGISVFVNNVDCALFSRSPCARFIVYL